MNVLIVGSGGREHALAWKLRQSPLLKKLYCAPGNPGIEREAECVNIDVMDFDGLIEFAKRNEVTLTVVGPENPLAGGIVDRFAKAGLRAFGPSAAAAQLESSKAFAKDLMTRYEIPTAGYAEFTDAEQAKEYVRKHGAPIVVKIEEASIYALSDGRALIPLATSQDHKRVYDNDEGPNTGGMGAYSPAPVVTPQLFEEIESRVLRPCIDGMAEDGHPYRGVLYAGLMITADGPKVIEFNCRFGDPETQVVLPRMKSDLLPLLDACAHRGLDGHSVAWHSGACVTVVMASGGYPGKFEKGKPITGIEDAEQSDETVVFHAGTRREDSKLLTNGGRVLNVTARGPDIKSTIDRAYAAVSKISFDQAHYRTDIGHRALAHLTV